MLFLSDTLKYKVSRRRIQTISVGLVNAIRRGPPQTLAR